MAKARIRSNGVNVEVDAGMTVAAALKRANVRVPWRGRVSVGTQVVGYEYVLKDEDVLTVAPKAKNG